MAPLVRQQQVSKYVQQKQVKHNPVKYMSPTWALAVYFTLVGVRKEAAPSSFRHDHVSRMYDSLHLIMRMFATAPALLYDGTAALQY